MHETTFADADSDRARLAQALVRAGTGSRDALAEVYKRSSAKLFGICLRILKSESDAEDTLQDIYVNVWRKAGSFDPSRASPISWLAAIARNRAIDRLRAGGGRRMEPIDDAFDVADDTPTADQALETAEDGERLRRCLGTLDGRSAEAIRSAFWGGQTYADLAARSGVPLGTMKSQIRRGLLRLRDCLGQ